MDRGASKVDAVAERVAGIYHDHADVAFGADPEPGAAAGVLRPGNTDRVGVERL